MTHEEIKRNLLETDTIISMLEDIERVRLRPLINSIYRYTHLNEHGGKHINYKDGSYEDVMYYTLLARQLETISKEANFIERNIDRIIPDLSEISEFVSDFNANSFYDKIKSDDDKARITD